jgi:3-isopropylmalate dehydrogenase
MVEIGVLSGDGIGPDIVSSAAQVLEACGDCGSEEIELRRLPVGFEAYREFGSTLPDQTIDGLEACDGCILGPVRSGAYLPDDALNGNPSGTLRTHFDLYANIRPVRSYPEIGPEGMDVVLFRQNTEGFTPTGTWSKGAGSSDRSKRRSSRCGSSRDASVTESRAALSNSRAGRAGRR